MRWKIAPAICGLLLLACGPASAQVFMGQTVASCGTVPSTRSAGIPYPVLMDTNGNFCTNASGSGGGGAVFGPTATGSAAANPPVLIGGTTTGGATGTVQGAAVKPASTAPLATDPALVVAISPNTAGGLVQTSPPSYGNGASEPPTLNKDGSIAVNGPLNLGAFTCSTLCSSTNRTLMSTNTWNYTTFSAQVTASDGSLLEADVSYDGGTTWSQISLETINSTTSTTVGTFSGFFIPTNAGVAVCGRIFNPGGLLRVYFTSWASGTETIQATLSNSNQCGSPTTFLSGGVTTSDSNAHTNFGTTNQSFAITTSSANNLVVKASSGLVYSCSAVNLTGVSGFLDVLNSATDPSDGSVSTTLQEFVPIPAFGSASFNYIPGPALAYGTGITAVLTQAATPLTKTTTTITGIIKCLYN